MTLSPLAIKTLMDIGVGGVTPLSNVGDQQLRLAEAVVSVDGHWPLIAKNRLLTAKGAAEFTRITGKAPEPERVVKPPVLENVRLRWPDIPRGKAPIWFGWDLGREGGDKTVFVEVHGARASDVDGSYKTSSPWPTGSELIDPAWRRARDENQLRMREIEVKAKLEMDLLKAKDEQIAGLRARIARLEKLAQERNTGGKLAKERDELKQKYEELLARHARLVGQWLAGSAR